MWRQHTMKESQKLTNLKANLSKNLNTGIFTCRIEHIYGQGYLKKWEHSYNDKRATRRYWDLSDKFERKINEILDIKISLLK